MKEALYYKKLKENAVNCNLCPTKCVIKQGDFGNCGARKNIDGRLYSLVYGKPVSTAIDPIEKKPLYHFLPGSNSLSVGTLGCNLHCLHCQNYDISQADADESSSREILPKDLIDIAVENGCKSISYTYNEPTIFFEYVLETAKLARKKGIKNIMVTNGYINKEPLKELYPLIDAANIDLKSIDEDFYKNICKVRLKPVLDSIKMIHGMDTWIEVTNLLIPGHNDSDEQIKKLVGWVKKNLGERVPLHFSAFFPTYNLLDAPRTSPDRMLKAKEIALKQGLKHVYLGNVSLPGSGDTKCPKCDRVLVERGRFEVKRNDIKKGSCPYCNEEIDGLF